MLRLVYRWIMSRRLIAAFLLLIIAPPQPHAQEARYCFEASPCPGDQFCNYSGDVEGYCEYCLEARCQYRGLTARGEANCLERCDDLEPPTAAFEPTLEPTPWPTRERSTYCSAASPCTEDKFCSFRQNTGYGECEPCPEVWGCRESDLSTNGLSSCLKSCEATLELGTLEPSNEPTPTPLPTYRSETEPSGDYPACRAYITGYDSFDDGKGPFPIECGEHDYGDHYGQNAHQSSSCCSANGRMHVMSGQIGGFDAGYESGYDPRCAAYASALSATLCSPEQGDFIVSFGPYNTFRVCSSACDAVFDACGLPGVNFPSWAEYTDGPSLCREMFGGFGAATPCEGRPDGYPCRSGLVLDVAVDECLDIIHPTELELEYAEEHYELPNACEDNAWIVFVVIGALVLWCCCGCCFCCCFAKKLQNANVPKLGDGASTPITNDAPMNSSFGGARSIPLASATPILNDGPDPPLTAKIVTANRDDDANDGIPSAPPLPSSLPVSDGTSMATLEQRLDEVGSFGRLEAIRQWTHENPNLAASLSPEDVASALSKVTFSLEQAAATREIASGMERAGGRVTCNHAVMAVRACSVSAVDVAKEIVPFISDPVNKDTLLSEFRYTYERDAVESAFQAH